MHSVSLASPAHQLRTYAQIMLEVDTVKIPPQSNNQVN